MRRSLFLSLVLAVVWSASALAQSADLSVAKIGPATASAGSDVTYTIDVTNLGPDDADTVVLTDNIPNGMTFVSSSPAGCTTPQPGSGGTIDCTIPTLAASATTRFTFVFNIPSGTTAGTTFSNIATVSSNTPDPNEENNSSTAGTTVPSTTAADVGVTKSGPTAAGPGDRVTYTIVVNNSGPNAAQNFTLTDTLPGTMTFASLAVIPSSILSCTTPAVGSGGTITCTSNALPVSTPVTITLQGDIPSGTPSGTTFTNTVDITSADDQNPENDQATTTLTVVVADLAITKVAPATATAGSTVSFTITVRNNGPDPATSVSFTDTLPPALIQTITSIVQNSGPAFNCSPTPAGTTSVTCTAGLLPAASIAVFTLNATVKPSAPSGATITNTATVSSPEVVDPNTTNNTATTNNTTVTTSADLSVTKSGPATTTAGTTIIYTLTAANAGPSDAQTVTLTDVLPANTTFSSITPPAGFTCTTPAVGASGTVTCTTATLVAGASVSGTLVLNVSPGATGALANTATISSSTTEINPTNNSSTATSTVGVSADLAITKTGPAAPAAGTDVNYSITVTNNGPSNAQTVTMTDVLPANTTFVSVAAPGGWNCTTPAVGGIGTITCTTPTLASGASAPFTLVVHVGNAAATGTVISNTATVSSTTPDPVTTNNAATTNGTVGTSADLAVTKTGPANAPPNANVTYTIGVTNAGPSTAVNVVLTDAVPATSTFVSATQTSGPTFNCTTPAAGAAGTITCTAASFAAGAAANFSIVVQTSIAGGGPITNAATVSSATPDPNTTNNSATVQTSVGSGATDLAITKTASTDALLFNGAFSYALRVTNNGPQTAFGVTVTDTLPAGVTLVSATPSQGTCTGTTTVVCSLGTLANAAAATINIVVTAGTTAGTTTNTATVSALSPDPNPANNTATAVVNIVAPVPALSPATLLLLAAALAIGGAVAMKGRG